MKSKIEKVLGEYKRGTLHSGSKTGPRVKNRKQALAIAIKLQAKMKKSAHGSGPIDMDDLKKGHRMLERCEGMAGGKYK